MLNDLPLMDLKKLFFLLCYHEISFWAPWCSLLLLVLFRAFLSCCESAILLGSETGSLKTSSLGNNFQATWFLSVAISPSH